MDKNGVNFDAMAKMAKKANKTFHHCPPLPFQWRIFQRVAAETI
jgi:hypothetical protein